MLFQMVPGSPEASEITGFISGSLTSLELPINLDTQAGGSDNHIVHLYLWVAVKKKSPKPLSPATLKC